jgi:hypothetical protein
MLKNKCVKENSYQQDENIHNKYKHIIQININ